MHAVSECMHHIIMHSIKNEYLFWDFLKIILKSFM